jgi:hypothetical protein
MNLLAQLYSYGDGLKRKVNGLLSDPMGTASLGATRMAEDQQGLLGLMDQAGYTPGSKSVLQRPQDTQQARNALADAAMQSYGGLLGATVWHGSPHKFDKFDSSKIGTGEGSQAYGHGLYLAENPTVARQYQEALAGGGVVDKAGKKISPSVGPEANAIRALKDSNYDFDSAISQLGKPMTGSDKGWGIFAAGAQKHRDQQVEFLKKLKAEGARFDSPGSLYKVDLPDEHIAKMLDWDKPLSQQAPDVADAVRKAFPGTYVNGRYVDPANSQLTGKALLDQLTAIANKRGAPGMRQAEPALREAGIPGIRYLDGGSRGAGGGTSNYVVFPGNEGLLQILERNGSPIN